MDVEQEQHSRSDHLIVKSVQAERKMELVMHENLQCHFNLASYKMVYIANSEECVYLKGALQRARRVNGDLMLSSFSRELTDFTHFFYAISNS